MDHSLPPLPFAYNALEPWIDARTMEIHHSRHHQAYITNYLKLLEGTGLAEKHSPHSLLRHIDEVSLDKRQGVINNLGGHINHTFFWTILMPDAPLRPIGTLPEAINIAFGSFESFQEQFTAKALSVFGSGWAWLCMDDDRKLVITSTPGQNSPIYEGLTPLLTLDVWEHAYYLKHQNKRADYIADFWHVINWAEVERLFTS